MVSEIITIKSFLYLAALVFGATGALIISKFGDKVGLSDTPNERSSHSIVTPKGGGIGILAAFIAASLVLGMPGFLWIPAIFLSLFSLWADRTDISPLLRLSAQFLAAFFLICGLYKNNQIAGYQFYFLSTVYIVWTANCYNFMDGINGIAGITGIVGFGLLAYYSFDCGADSTYICLMLSICLSCIGFLPFNIPAAKVFMGDVGSILLGFVFSGIVVVLSESLVDSLCMACLIFPFYADELTTMIVRIINKENLLHPHRKHLYQLLCNEYGISHWKVSAGYGLLQLLIGISVLLVKDKGYQFLFTMLLFYLLIFSVCSYQFRKRLVHVKISLASY